jgi:hypothetical protein
MGYRETDVRDRSPQEYFEDGGKKFLRNVDICLQNYTASHSKRLILNKINKK